MLPFLRISEARSCFFLVAAAARGVKLFVTLARLACACSGATGAAAVV